MATITRFTAVEPLPIHCSPDVTYTPVSQTTGGSGTTADPYTITTTVSLTSTLNLVQVVTYAVGSQQINETFQLVGSGPSVTANIFHGADIYLAESDQGFGYFVPKTGNSNSNGVNFQVGGINAVDQTTGAACSRL